MYWHLNQAFQLKAQKKYQINEIIVKAIIKILFGEKSFVISAKLV